jgi:hypothetical protein
MRSGDRTHHTPCRPIRSGTGSGQLPADRARSPANLRPEVARLWMVLRRAQHTCCLPPRRNDRRPAGGSDQSVLSIMLGPREPSADRPRLLGRPSTTDQVRLELGCPVGYDRPTGRKFPFLPDECSGQPGHRSRHLGRQTRASMDGTRMRVLYLICGPSLLNHVRPNLPGMRVHGPQRCGFGASVSFLLEMSQDSEVEPEK